MYRTFSLILLIFCKIFRVPRLSKILASLGKLNGEFKFRAVY